MKEFISLETYFQIYVFMWGDAGDGGGAGVEEKGRKTSFFIYLFNCNVFSIKIQNIMHEVHVLRNTKKEN